MMSNLDNMKLMMLQPINEDTKRMIHWLETDVNSALVQSYLHRLHFLVSRDPEGMDLIEQYSYTFQYSPSGVLQPP